ncbi:MAG: hypothetical protein H7338_21805 [Candidatus Sericytochromatia bacterium]|nr:hypothetical protein [Candidatus Sericytochromatia bacterium]
MSAHAFCLAITVPPPDEERHFVAALQGVFPNLQSAHLQPFLDTGDDLYLTGQDHPAGQLIVEALREAGLGVRPGDPTQPLHQERTAVMPYPGSSEQIVIVSLCRASSLPATIAAPPLVMHGHTLSPSAQTDGPRCRQCGAPDDAILPFCPHCAHTPPPENPVTVNWRIRLPEGARRTRLVGWLAKATGLPIPKLRLQAGGVLHTQVSAPPGRLDQAEARLASWGAEVTRTPDRTDPLWNGIRHLFGLGRLEIAPATIATLTNPIPAALQADLRQCLAETTGSGLQVVVQKTLQAVSGIHQAIGTSDEISQYLWQSIDTQVSAVAAGIVSLVRRGRQLEQYLAAHTPGQLAEEGRRLDRLVARTTDPVTVANYQLALQGNAKSRQRHEEAVLTGERLASQLFVLMGGLADVHAAVTMGGLREVGKACDTAPVVAQLHELQSDVRAIDESLAAFFDT